MKNETGRIVVTGLGSVSAAGTDMTSLWESAGEERINVRSMVIAGCDRPISVYAAGEIPVATPKEHRLVRHADRSAQLALHAALEAWRTAGLDKNPADPLRTGLVIGSSRGPAEFNHRVDQHLLKKATDSSYTAFSSISGIIATALKIQGCSLMTSATCISSAVAIKTAMQLLHSDELDVALVGGVDAPLVDSLLEQFAATQVLSLETGPQALLPFGKNRRGTVLGEGACFIVVESEKSAHRRDASILGLMLHVALGCDPGFRAGGNKNGEGLRRTIENALRFLEWKPTQVDLLHLHGTGTLLNDSMESLCVQNLFGPVEGQPISWATKGLTGHTLGASAVFQVALTLEAMRQSYLPGTTNGSNQDPLCPIRLSLAPGSHQPLGKALCLTSGFWGNTSCIALGR